MTESVEGSTEPGQTAAAKFIQEDDVGLCRCICERITAIALIIIIPVGSLIGLFSISFGSKIFQKLPGSIFFKIAIPLILAIPISILIYIFVVMLYAIFKTVCCDKKNLLNDFKDI